MLLVVGLGNPGEKYEKTRHNIGFMLLDDFVSEHKLSEFRSEKKSNSFTSKGFIGDTKVLLVKPQTFMNNSGLAVKSLYTKYSILDTQYLLVVHDDIDLPLGKIRISMGSGSAGHKGVDSIIQHLGTKNFARIRIGIQPLQGKPDDVENFVLKKFSKEELEVLSEAIKNSSFALETILTDGIEKAMNEFNE